MSHSPKQSPTPQELELLERQSYLGAIWHFMVGLVLGLLAWNLYSPAPTVIGFALSLLGPATFYLFVYIAWKHRKVARHDPFFWMFGLSFPFVDGGFVGQVMSRAMSLSYYATLFSILLFYGRAANDNGPGSAPATFYLFGLGAVLTHSYSLAFLVQYHLGDTAPADEEDPVHV